MTRLSLIYSLSLSLSLSVSLSLSTSSNVVFVLRSVHLYIYVCVVFHTSFYHRPPLLPFRNRSNSRNKTNEATTTRASDIYKSELLSKRSASLLQGKLHILAIKVKCV